MRVFSLLDSDFRAMGRFLYRRLCPVLPCHLLIQEGHLALASKYEIASFQDVFCHPYYWTIHDLLKDRPRRIIDVGAHCGHFSVLLDTCIRSKYGVSDASYCLIEANPNMLSYLRRNVATAGMASRVTILNGMVGINTPTGKLWSDRKNFLTASAFPGLRERSCEVPRVNLATVFQSDPIDVMKVDIEGSEYEMMDVDRDTLARTKILFMEVHPRANADRYALVAALEQLGFTLLPHITTPQGALLVRAHRVA